MKIPAGFGVSERITGRLGLVLRTPRGTPRGLCLVRFDGDPVPCLVRPVYLNVVARRYADMVRWYGDKRQNDKTT